MTKLYSVVGVMNIPASGFIEARNKREAMKKARQGLTTEITVDYQSEQEFIPQEIYTTED